MAFSLDINAIAVKTLMFGIYPIPVVELSVEINGTGASSSNGRFRINGTELTEKALLDAVKASVGGSIMGGSFSIRNSFYDDTFPTHTYINGGFVIVCSSYHSSDHWNAANFTIRRESDNGIVAFSYTNSLGVNSNGAFCPLFVLKNSNTGKYLVGASALSTGHCDASSVSQFGNVVSSFIVPVRSISDLTSVSNNYPYFGNISSTEIDISPFIPPPTDPYSPGGNTEPGGGGMSGDPPPHDSVDFPDNPVISATKAGFVSIWTPTEGQVEKLAAYLWTTDILTGAFWKKIIQNPLDLIFGLQIMPVSIYHTEGEPEPRREDEYLAMNDNVVLGWTNTRIKMDYIPEQFVEVDCGEIDMEEYWKAYLDYAPYTKIDIYLPYIGVKTLNTNDCMSRTIHLKYKIDLASGSCVAIIKCDDSVYYHFSGNCASAVPLTAVQMQEVIRNAMTTAVAVGAAVMTAGADSSPLAIGAAKVAAAASAARTVMTGPEYHRSGSNASTTGLMSVQTPYLIITRPRQAIPEDQNTYTGYPSFITEQIGDLTGYTEIEIIHMHDLTCTSEEFTEIEDLLLKGVII